MTTGWIVLLVGVTWLAIGLVTAFAMGRRGHSPFAWGVLGTMLGPLAIVLAFDAVRHQADDGLPAHGLR